MEKGWEWSLALGKHSKNSMKEMNYLRGVCDIFRPRNVLE